jgi:hypothetical protein
MSLPFRLLPADRVEDDATAETIDSIAPPTDEGALSALAEAQCLEMLGKFGGIRTVLLRVLSDPARRGNTPESRAIRTALGLANEGVQIAQAVTYSTTRRGVR